MSVQTILLNFEKVEMFKIEQCNLLIASFKESDLIPAIVKRTEEALTRCDLCCTGMRVLEI